jgi:hypothetical protein
MDEIEEVSAKKKQRNGFHGRDPYPTGPSGATGLIQDTDILPQPFVRISYKYRTAGY